MDELQRLETWLNPLLAALQPAERRALAREVARMVRAEQVKNLKAQTGPDGTPWQPRKNRTRDTRGRLRAGAMFTKLRQAKHLKAHAYPESAVVQFLGRTERLARVHHFGLRDRVTASGPDYQYPARPLLGITPELAEALQDLILERLQSEQ